MTAHRTVAATRLFNSPSIPCGLRAPASMRVGWRMMQDAASVRQTCILLLAASNPDSRQAPPAL
jgi:hypothetical protein